MKTFLILIIFTSFSFQTETVWCQSFQQIAENKTSTAQSFPGEKIYVKTDKNFYLAGETIWFRVFCVNQDFTRTSVSTLAYVELIDASGVPVAQAKVKLSKSNDHGSFKLPLQIQNGNFTLRAYTNVMRNKGSGNLFEKNITIINTLKKFESPKNSQSGLQLGFYPEGGNFVAGLESRVAFKLADAFGKGVDCRGVIMQGSDTVARFSTHRFGIGHFQFQPKPGVEYSALAYLPDGNSISHNLPAVKQGGYVMQTNKIDEHHIRVVIRTTYNGDFQKLNLVITNRKDARIIREFSISQGSADAVIDISELGDGILQLALYNASGQSIAESLQFIRPAQHASIKIKSDQEFISSRSKLYVTLEGADAKQLTNGADVSVSVRLLDSLEQNDEPGIMAGLWFDGYLKGVVESPEYYFDSSHADLEDATQDLLMAQGRRAADRIIEHHAVFIPEMNGHIVTAQIINERTGRPGINKLAFLSIPGRHFGFYTAQSDSDGIVKFEIRNVEGPSEMILQTQLIDSMYRIRLLTPFPESDLKTEPIPFNLVFSESDLKKRSIAVQAQLIYARSVEQTVSSTNTDTLPFFGKPHATYLLDDYKRFTTMEEVLREYVREVNVSVQDGKPALKMYNEQLMDFFSQGILVMIDGVPLADPNKIFSVDPLTIKKLDIISRSYILGPAVFTGILSFTTAEGNAPGLKDLYPSLVRMDYEGIQLHREFPTMKYETADAKESHLPDFRSTLYWNPSLQVKNNSTPTFDFYTSDMKGKYLISVEGIDSNGYPFESSAVITVK